VKLLVKETTNLVEAMKLASSIFLLGSNMSMIQVMLHTQNQSGFLNNEEILAMHSFFFDIMMNPNQNSLSSKIAHATQGLVKVVQGESKEKLPGNEKFTYADLKKIIEKTISNHRLANDIFLNVVGPTQFFQPQMQVPHHFVEQTHQTH
jgi:hypothetical protein